MDLYNEMWFSIWQDFVFEFGCLSSMKIHKLEITALSFATFKKQRLQSNKEMYGFDNGAVSTMILEQSTEKCNVLPLSRFNYVLVHV